MKKIAIALVIFLSGCCTLKDCDSTEEPTVILSVLTFAADSIKGFNDTQINNLMIHVCDNNYTTLDSFRYWNSFVSFQATNNAVIYLSNYFIKDKMGTGDISSYNYLFVIPGKTKTDTLSSVKYGFNSEKVDCNSCFPFGDGSATQTTIGNFSCIFNSKLVTGKTDTLRIEK